LASRANVPAPNLGVPTMTSRSVAAGPDGHKTGAAGDELSHEFNSFFR